MTWTGDRAEARVDDATRDKLLAERAALVKDIQVKSLRPPARSQAGRNADQEELLALAKKVTAIDRKLGRA